MSTELSSDEALDWSAARGGQEAVRLLCKARPAMTSGNASSQLDFWQEKSTGGDQVVPRPYASGMSRLRDLRAAIASGVGVGTVITELSRAGMRLIAQAVAAGKEVFVDSGAFSRYRAALRVDKPELAKADFDDVFERYADLSLRVMVEAPRENRSLLMLVAPDVVGDQVATIDLIRVYRESIIRWMEHGHEVIIPFQRGPISQHEVFRQLQELLEMPFVVGIPSNAAALRNEDLFDLLSPPYKPDRLHILGAISSRRMAERLALIRHLYEFDVPGVTCDANILRANTARLAGLSGETKSQMIKEILNERIPMDCRP